MYLGKNERAARNELVKIARDLAVFVPVSCWRAACTDAGIGRQRFHEVFKSLVEKKIMVVREDGYVAVVA